MMKRLLYCYAGSKWKLAQEFVRLFPPHKTYLCPCLGTGAEFAYKKPSLREIINDLDDIPSIRSVIKVE